MSSAGRSGTSDTEHTNLPGGQDNPQGYPTGMPPEMSSATGAHGPIMPGENAPEDQIEMVEIMEVGDLDEYTREMELGGFRWWYVPAIGLPVAVGAGAAIWYLTKGQEPYRNAWELVTRPVRNLTGQSRPAARTKKAARKAGATSETLREKLTDTFGGFDATELADKAGDLWDDARESMVDLWDQITDRGTRRRARGTAGDARDAMQRQLGKVVGSVAAAGTALAIQKKMSDLASATQEKAQAARNTAQDTARRVTGRRAARRRRMAFGLGAIGGAWLARNRAQAKAMQRRGRFWMMRRRAQSRVAGLTDTTGNLADRVKGQLAKQGASVATKSTAKAVKFKSQRAMKQTRRRITSPFRRVRAFAFAALVTAMVIYVRSWYSRRSGTAGGPNAGDMRETASGRMEPDTWPRFAGRAPDAAMPTVTNSPTEPS